MADGDTEQISKSNVCSILIWVLRIKHDQTGFQWFFPLAACGSVGIGGGDDAQPLKGNIHPFISGYISYRAFLAATYLRSCENQKQNSGGWAIRDPAHWPKP